MSKKKETDIEQGAAEDTAPKEPEVIKVKIARLGLKAVSFRDPTTGFTLSGGEERELPARIPTNSLIPKWIKRGGLIVREASRKA